ncbi:MAG: hypothetical protein MjAS7_1317 [Metallosphaera javensis (ex Sakai et al. 2022)]|nr:MAG: hypothetical protein MjAS7_1317 [Metallosphaera javensis (ex Sakai et al. 2022)]
MSVKGISLYLNLLNRGKSLGRTNFGSERMMKRDCLSCDVVMVIDLFMTNLYIVLEFSR